LLFRVYVENSGWREMIDFLSGRASRGLGKTSWPLDFSLSWALRFNSG